jgi:hypothetical protein
MANNINEQEASRRKILKWGSLSSIALLFTGFKISKLFSVKKEVISCGPPSESKMVKMLTQDGVLVEVDISKLSQKTGVKISDNQLQNWVNKKS